MNLFSKKPAEPEPDQVTGTAALRDLLKLRARKWNVSNIARDINDNMAQDNQRAAARDIATRIAGNTDSGIAADIARSLVGSLPSSAGRETGVSPSELESFMNGNGDLSPDVKTQLARLLFRIATPLSTLREICLWSPNVRPSSRLARTMSPIGTPIRELRLHTTSFMRP